MSSNSAFASPAGRTRTPSELRWLLNERAALQGQAQVTSERREVLKRRAARLEALLTEARWELSKLSDHATLVATRINDLDATIGALHAGVRADAAGCVKAWAGRYGERGALTAFIREYLQAVSPRAVLCAEIKRQVITRFELVLLTPDERVRLGHSVRNVLVRLRGLHGVLESVENWRGGQSRTLWRWKQAPSSLDGLRLAALDAAEADELNPHAGTIRGQVVGQRAGDARG